MLGIWFVVALAGLDGVDLDRVRTWLSAPLDATLLLLLIGTLAWHSMLGLQVVIEDYVGSQGSAACAADRDEIRVRACSGGRRASRCCGSRSGCRHERRHRSSITATTSSWSAPAARGCARRSGSRRRACRPPASPRCSRRAATRWRRRAASAPRSATWARTTGAFTSTTPSRARTGSATRTRSSSCARKRPRPSSSSSTTACRSRAPRTAASTSGRSAA